ncbi:hypothetical protein ACFWFF_24810, partial [Streptomyces sp. NPDC060223]|uniref:hypothetical protein n=1 Tax=Streptomyces sp. NPDC060223 TaxID=3347077 RepID=UPI00365BBB0E
MPAGGASGDGHQIHEPVVEGVAVPDGLGRQYTSGGTRSSGDQRLQVEWAVRGAGDPVSVVEIAVVDNELGVVEAQTAGTADLE